jgi:hypothetical protein
METSDLPLRESQEIEVEPHSDARSNHFAEEKAEEEVKLKVSLKRHDARGDRRWMLAYFVRKKSTS